MAEELLISDIIAVGKIEADVAKVIKALNEFDATVDSLNKKSIGLAQISSLRDLRKAVDDINGLAQKLSSGLIETATASNKVGESTKKSTDALALLNREYRDAQRFARNMAAIYGAQSEQALEAARAAQELKRRLDEVNSVTKVEKNQKNEQTSVVSTRTETVSVKVNTPDLSAYDKLKKDIKEAELNAKNLALEFGVDSKEAKTAADQVFDLKRQLQEIDNLTKQRKDSAKVVPFTTNLQALKDEQEALQENTTAINERDKAEADSVMSANEWAAAQQLVNDENLKVAEGLERIKTPFEDYTGTLQQNVLQNKEYKDRIAEISAEIKLLDKTYSEAEKSTDAYKNKVAALLEEQSILKSSSSELGRVILQQSNYVKSAEGSYDQMNATLEIALRLQKQMNDDDKNSTFGQELQRTIDELDASLKEQDAQMGIFRRNVGGYANSLGGFFDTLTAEIKKLKVEQQSLQDLSQRNPIGFQLGGGAERLNQVNAQLQGLQGVQQVGFKLTGDPVQQINTLTEGMDRLKKSGVENAQVIEALQQAIQNIKMPDYSGNFQGAFQILASELNAVRDKLKDPALQGVELQKLQREEKLLTQLTSSLSRQFTSTREEFRALQEAVKQVGINMGTTGGFFLKLTEEVGQAKDSIDDINAVIKQNASDTRYFDAAIAAANGLAGAYGAAQGAAQLLDNDNEELQRTMVKLQAILTIINGLQAVQNALQKESGVVQALLAVKMKIMQGAQAVQAALFQRSAVAAQADTAAQVENAVAKEANAAATEQISVASAGAAKSTTALKGVLAFTGVAAAIGAVVAVIAFLGKKLYDIYTGAAYISKLRKEFEELDAQVKSNIDNLSDYFGWLDRIAQAPKVQLQIDNTNVPQLTAMKNELKNMGIESEVAKQKLELFKKEVVGPASALFGKASSAFLNNASPEAVTGLNNGFIDGMDLKGKDKDLYEFYKKASEASTKAEQEAGQLATTVEVNAKNLQLKTAEIAKVTGEQQRKITQDNANYVAGIIKTKNDEVLASEKSTLSQRLNALRSNYEAQKSIVAANEQAVLSDPTKSTADRNAAIKTALLERRRLQSEFNKSTFDEEEKWRLRVVEATKAMLVEERQLYSDLQKEISADTNFNLQGRLGAEEQYFSAQRSILDAEYTALKESVKNKAQSAEEKAQIEADYQNKILRLTIDYQKRVQEVLKSEAKKQSDIRQQDIEKIQLFYSRQDVSDTEQYTNDVIALNDALNKKEISYSSYQKKRKKLDDDYSIQQTQRLANELADELSKYQQAELNYENAVKNRDRIQKQVDNATTPEQKALLAPKLKGAQEEVDLTKKAVDEKIGLEKKYTEAKSQESDKRVKKTREEIDAEKAMYDEYLGAAGSLMQNLASATDAIYDRRIDQIQGEMTALDERYRLEQEMINATYKNQTERDQKLNEAAKRNAAQRKALEEQEKQEKMKKAQADKAAAVMNVIIGTAQAIIRDLGTPWKIAIDAAIGAAQLATVMAAPLPRYFRGRNANDTYEGPAIVGDGGRPELIVRRDGSVEVTPSVPTITQVQRGDEIKPDAKHELAKRLQQRQLQITDIKDYKKELVYRSMLNTHRAEAPYNKEELAEVIQELKVGFNRVGQKQDRTTRAVERIKPGPRLNIDHMKLWVGSSESGDNFLRRMNGK